MAWAGVSYAQRARTWVVADRDSIVVKHPFRSAVTVRVGDIARVFKFTEMVPDGKYWSYKGVLFAFSTAGRCVISFRVGKWDPNDLDQLWQFVG